MRSKISGSGGYHIGMFGRPLVMREGEKDGKGGTGGEEGGDDDEEKKFTERFNKLFHKAMSEREKRLETKIMKGLETTLGAKFDELTTKLGEAGKQKEEPPPGDESKLRDRGKFIPAELAAEIAKVKNDAKEARELAEKFKKEAEAEKSRASKTEERQLLVTSLGGRVKPQLLDMVVDQLHGKHVTRDPETGKILWKGEDGDVLPFKDGVDSWTKSDFAKEVAPPREARGSGGRGGSGDGGQMKGPMTADQLGQLISGAIPGSR